MRNTTFCGCYAENARRNILNSIQVVFFFRRGLKIRRTRKKSTRVAWRGRNIFSSMKGGKQHVVEKCFGEAFRYTCTKMDREVQGFEMHMFRMRICKAREQVDCSSGISRRALKSNDISRVCGADGDVVASCSLCTASSITRMGNSFKGWCPLPLREDIAINAPTHATTRGYG